MDTDERHASLSRTLAAIQHHQQGHHGWSVLYQALQDLHEIGQDHLHRILMACWASRPHISDVHLVTLLGIAVRALSMRWPSIQVVFRPEVARHERLAELTRVFADHESDLMVAISEHSNSFTGARRFLVPQLLIGAFAAKRGISEVRFLDIGTGIGILPRQMNHRAVFDRFAADLAWDAPELNYQEIPLSCRYGVDAHPLPTLEWVRTCYGPSEYYEERFAELAWSIEQTAGAADAVTIEQLNIVDLLSVAGYLQEHRFNAITCNFVLYQYDETVRRSIIAAIVENLAWPGLFLSMEPSHGLFRQGCRVSAYLADDPEPIHVAEISDAHFIGTGALCGAGLDVLLGTSGRRET